MSACPPLPVLEQDIKLRTSVLYIQAALKYFQVTIQRHGRTFPWAFGHTNGSGQDFVHGRTTRNVYDLVRSVVTPRSITCNPCTFQTPIKKNQPTSSYTTVANLSYASAVANISLKFSKSVALSKIINLKKGKHLISFNFELN